MEFYILNGIVKTFNNIPKSQVGLTSFTTIIKRILTRLGVAFADPCCVDGQTSFPVAYNPTTNSFTFDNGPLNAIPIAGVATYPEYANNAAALAGTLLVGAYYKTTTNGIVVIKQVV